MRVNANSSWIQRGLIRALGIQGRFPVELESAASPTIELASLAGQLPGPVLDHLPCGGYNARAAGVGVFSMVGVTAAVGKVLVVDSFISAQTSGFFDLALLTGVDWSGIELTVTAKQLTAYRADREGQETARSLIWNEAAAAGATMTGPGGVAELNMAAGAQAPFVLPLGIALYGNAGLTGWRSLAMFGGVANLAVSGTFLCREYELTQWLQSA